MRTLGSAARPSLDRGFQLQFLVILGVRTSPFSYIIVYITICYLLLVVISSCRVIKILFWTIKVLVIPYWNKSGKGQCEVCWNISWKIAYRYKQNKGSLCKLWHFRKSENIKWKTQEDRFWREIIIQKTIDKIEMIIMIKICINQPVPCSPRPFVNHTNPQAELIGKAETIERKANDADDAWWKHTTRRQ